MKSIITDKEECYLCKCTVGLETHHVWHGTANRRLAEEDGLTVPLCQTCHRRVHDQGINDKFLMRAGERAWIEHTGQSVVEFIKRYGRNYL